MPDECLSVLLISEPDVISGNGRSPEFLKPTSAVPVAGHAFLDRREEGRTRSRHGMPG